MSGTICLKYVETLCLAPIMVLQPSTPMPINFSKLNLYFCSSVTIQLPIASEVLLKEVTPKAKKVVIILHLVLLKYHMQIVNNFSWLISVDSSIIRL